MAKRKNVKSGKKPGTPLEKAAAEYREQPVQKDATEEMTAEISAAEPKVTEVAADEPSTAKIVEDSPAVAKETCVPPEEALRLLGRSAIRLLKPVAWATLCTRSPRNWRSKTAM